MVQIYIPADDVWLFFQSNIDRLKKEMVAIAENEDTGYAVYLTEDKGYPSFAVCKDDEKPEYEEGAINESDCAETAKRCFVRYLFPVVVNDRKGIPQTMWDEDDEEDMMKQDMQDSVYEREDELRLALYTRDCDNFPIQVNLEAVQREIRKAPTIDAVQVIRCKDCKFGLSSTHEGYLLCSAFVNKNYVVPNGFCSEAEIKD